MEYYLQSLRDATNAIYADGHSLVNTARRSAKYTLLIIIIIIHPFNDLFSKITWVSRYQKSKTNLDLNEARDDVVLGWHRLDHMQTICTLLQTDNHTNTSSLNFYRPDALPDAQPTVSKH